ncbi:hypothetical protein RDWZM_009204 [Blomia tropicalis]|uniref:Presenilin n=1 Tax=Blomia tropicalis TaxID=40697 RepID=A0A9Q0M351_BLOTA|nr:hypothetical protein RDWZM_009204 [Blomia tropicalis]
MNDLDNSSKSSNNDDLENASFQINDKSLEPLVENVETPIQPRSESWASIGKPVLLVMTPILLTLILMLSLVTITCHGRHDECYNGGMSFAMPKHSMMEVPGQPFWTKVRNASKLATMVIVIIAFATFVVATVFYFGLMWFIICYVFVSISMGFFFFICIFMRSFLIYFDIPFDWITAGFIAWNFTGCGLVIFFIIDSPKLIKGIYLIFLSANLSTHILTLLPPFTTWFLLIGLVIWDLFAVLAPCGPLRWIVEIIRTAEKDVTNKKKKIKLPDVMIYSTMTYFTMSDKNSDNYTPDESLAPSNAKRNVKIADLRPQLGLGDFIFYSLLVGKTATMTSSIVTLLFVAISILIGLISTLLLLIAYRRALPALPISLTISLIVLFVAYNCTEPMLNYLNVNMIFV